MIEANHSSQKIILIKVQTMKGSHLIKIPLKKIAYSSPIRRVVAYSKEVAFPGFDNIPIYDVTDFFFTGIHRGKIIMRAQSLAFSFFLAIFPATIFLFSLIPYVPIHNFQDQLLALIKDVLPRNAYEAT